MAQVLRRWAELEQVGKNFPRTFDKEAVLVIAVREKGFG